MKDLDKELKNAILDNKDFDWVNLDEAVSAIKTVILEALKAEWPKNFVLSNPSPTDAYKDALADCLEVCNKLLGDSNAE